MPRRADLDDVTALLPLIRDFYGVDRHTYDESRVVSALEPLLADDEFGQVWVAEKSGQLLGYAVMTWSYSLESGGRECILDEIYVTSPSSGIGAGLLQSALDGARSYGANAVFLETEAHNSRARGFYRRFGFEIEDSVWMRRDLEAPPDPLEPHDWTNQ